VPGAACETPVRGRRLKRHPTCTAVAPCARHASADASVIRACPDIVYTHAHHGPHAGSLCLPSCFRPMGVLRRCNEFWSPTTSRAAGGPAGPAHGRGFRRHRDRPRVTRSSPPWTPAGRRAPTRHHGPADARHRARCAPGRAGTQSLRCRDRDHGLRLLEHRHRGHAARGAYDYITKPFDLDDILLTIQRYFEWQSLNEQVASLSTRLGNADPSDCDRQQRPMQEVYRRSVGWPARTRPS
jgi:hypothetical protein